METINIKNTAGQDVEKLDAFGNLFTIGHLSIIANSVTFNLKPDRQYEIHRIIIQLLYFEQLGAPAVFAFPNYEQFAIEASINIYTGKTATQITNPLANDFKLGITNGEVNEYAFNEPFIFQTTTSTDNVLTLLSSDAGSVFVNLTDMVYPPVGSNDTIPVVCYFSLEGVSYPMSSARLVNKLAFEKSLGMDSQLVKVEPQK